MAKESLVERVTRALEREAGIDAVVEERSGVLTLSGRVHSDDQRQAAEDVVRRLAPTHRVDNDLEVETVIPTTVEDFAAAGPSESDPPRSIEEIREMGADLAPDFTNQAVLTDPVAAAGPSAGWEDPVQEGDDVYVPPTDPVIHVDERGEVAVLGGFGPDSMDTVEVDRSADGRLGDEAIEDAVRRELREDAATTDLALAVHVRNGVVRLRGIVPDVTDAESAEEVAARVPGVVEVIDETEVAALRQ
jgi:osmotically-inducible protein OsmY